MFLGYFNLANFVTLLGLATSVTAMFAAVAHEFKIAILLFAFAGVCDSIDGKLARNRIDHSDTKVTVFGVMLDSLCDLVSFGVTPCVIAYAFGNISVFDLAVYILFCVFGAIRLAYYNTRALCSDGRYHGFIGVPITTSVVLLPPIIALAMVLDPVFVSYVLRVFFVALGFAFILKIKIDRPNPKTTIILALICVAGVAAMFAFPSVPVQFLT